MLHRRLPRSDSTSDDANVLRLLTLATLRNVELDVLALVEGLVSVTLNCGEVNEHVVTLLAGDEAVTLFCIEELNRALCHEILVSCPRPIDQFDRLAATQCIGPLRHRYPGENPHVS